MIKMINAILALSVLTLGARANDQIISNTGAVLGTVTDSGQVLDNGVPVGYVNREDAPQPRTRYYGLPDYTYMYRYRNDYGDSLDSDLYD